MDGKSSPLLAAGMKCTIFNMKISRANCLRSKAIEQSHSGARLDTYYNKEFAKRLIKKISSREIGNSVSFHGVEGT